MKILHIINNLHCGGAEKFVILLSRELNKKGINSEVAVLETAGDLGAEADVEGIHVLNMNKKPGFDPGLIFRLSRVIKNKKIDLVHTHNLGPLIYGSIAARLAGVKCINTRHGRSFARNIIPFIWNLNSKVIAVSQDARDVLVNKKHIPDSKVKLIYNAVDNVSFVTEPDKIVKKKQELKLVNEDEIIGIVARLSVEKDHETLLKAFKRVYSPPSIVHSKNIRLLIVGDGPMQDKLEAMVKEIGLQEHVLFLGFREDVAELMGIFDVFVLSSVREGLSLTLLEAMAASKPIVATDVGGNPEVVVPGETGLLVPPKNPEKMAEAILEILNDLDKAKRMGEAARKRVEVKFGLERMVAEYESVYKEVLAS